MSYKITINGDLGNQEKTWDLINFIFQQHGMPASDADVFTVAVGEAFGNGLLYSPDNCSVLTLSIHRDRIIAEVVNVGKKINFKAIEEFDTEHDFMQYKDGKLGIPMIKTLVDDVNYSHDKGKNKLILLKYIKNDSNVLKGEKNENY